MRDLSVEDVAPPAIFQPVALVASELEAEKHSSVAVDLNDHLRRTLVWALAPHAAGQSLRAAFVDKDLPVADACVD